MFDRFPSILKSALIAGVGAVLAYLMAALGNGSIDLGIYGPAVGGLLAWLANLVKVYLESQPKAPALKSLLPWLVIAVLTVGALGCCRCVPHTPCPAHVHAQP